MRFDQLLKEERYDEITFDLYLAEKFMNCLQLGKISFGAYNELDITQDQLVEFGKKVLTNITQGLDIRESVMPKIMENFKSMFYIADNISIYKNDMVVEMYLYADKEHTQYLGEFDFYLPENWQELVDYNESYEIVYNVEHIDTEKELKEIKERVLNYVG